MSELLEALRTDDVETRARAAYARVRAGGALSREEAGALLDALADTRAIEDSNDPPGYDWDGSPVYRGGVLRVSAAAADALRKLGGDALSAALEARLEGAPEARALACARAVELLGGEHAFVRGMLRHGREDVRACVARAFAAREDGNDRHLDALAPALLDPSDAVCAPVVAALRLHVTLRGPLAPGVLPPDALERARGMLPAGGAPSRASRVAAMALLGVFSAREADLARALAALPAGDLAPVAALDALEGRVIAALCECEPALRPRLKSAVFARFAADAPRWRFFAIGQLAGFAPDRDALELALTEVRLRASAADSVAPFVERAPALMPAVLDAVFASLRADQADAGSVLALYRKAPEAFARALADEPDAMEARLAALAKALRWLPDSREGEALAAEIRGRATAALAAKRAPG